MCSILLKVKLPMGREKEIKDQEEEKKIAPSDTYLKF
jgi:hypothetical protein